MKRCIDIELVMKKAGRILRQKVYRSALQSQRSHQALTASTLALPSLWFFVFSGPGSPRMAEKTQKDAAIHAENRTPMEMNGEIRFVKRSAGALNVVVGVQVEE